MDGQLARSRAEEIALDANVIAEVEQLVEQEIFFADIIFADVNLQALAVLLQVRESRLALAANGHDASCNRDFDAVGLELFRRGFTMLRPDLRNGVRRDVLIGIGLLSKSGDLVQLFLAEGKKIPLELGFKHVCASSCF